MKILIVSDTYYPIIDGVSRFIDHLGYYLYKEGHQITFVIPKLNNLKSLKFDYSSRPFSFLELPTLRVSIKDYNLSFPSFKLNSEIKKSDLIILNSLAFTSLYALIFNKLYKKKVIEFVHIDEREMLYYTVKIPYKIVLQFDKAIKLLMKDIDKFAVATNKFYNKCIEMGAKKESIFEVPFGYKAKKLTQKEIQDYRDKLHINKDMIVILYLGRLSFEKNVPTTVEVMGRLLKKYPNVKCIIGGTGYKYNEIKDLILSKSYDIDLLGRVPEQDLPLIYSVADFFLSPSFHEALGFTIVEAINYSTIPVINGKFNEHQFNDENSIIISNVKDVKQIEKKISNVLTDKSKVEKMKKNAYITANQFKWDKFRKIWIKEINNLFQT